MGLNSNSVIKIVDLLCEGPIDGLEGNRKGVYLDETALQAQTDEQLVDKDNVTYDFRPGTRGQAYLPQAKGRTSNVVDVNKEVGTGYEEFLNNDGVTVKSRDYGAGQQVVQITDPDVDSIDLVFTVPRLYSTAQEGLVKGQLFNAQIIFDVFIQAQGSGTAFKRIKRSKAISVSEKFKINGNKDVFFIEGISTTNYQFKIAGIQLEGKGPWNVRVRKYPDNTRINRSYTGRVSHARSDAGDIDQDIFRATFQEFKDLDKRTPLKNGRANTFVWSSVIENVNIRTAYPFSACVGLNISTEEFQSLPTRAYLVRGRRVRVPHNAVPRDDGSLEFVGAFNGSLGAPVWTTCPVCIFYDLITNKRYGAGDFIDADNLSWVDLYPLAQYANQLIGNEPRFACNVQVSSQVEAFTALQDFASVFRGMMYWQSNTIQLTADHGNLDGSDVNPVHIFSNSSVIEGVFNYSATSLKTRSTSIRIRYSDPENLYKPNVVVIEDSELITKYGYQVKDVLAFGCTSKKQAKRLGRWMIKSEELDRNSVTFAVGLDGALVFPGQVFAIQDELRAGVRLSGRISSSTTTTIVADQSITLPEGTNPTLTCVLTDGTVESKPINVAGTSGTTIAVTTSFSSEPLPQAVYSIRTDSVNEQKYRCLSVSDNGDGTFAVVGVEFNDSIYSAADQDLELEFDDITVIDEAPSKPVLGAIEFQLIEQNAGIANRAIASWTRGEDGFTISFDVRYRVDGGSFTTLNTSNTSIQVDNIQPGRLLEVQVRSVGIGNPAKKSSYVSTTAIAPDLPEFIVGEQILENVTDLTIKPISETQAVLSWNSPAVERLNNLIALVRHSSVTDGTGTFADAVNLINVPAAANSATVPLLNGEYIIKLQDQTTSATSVTAISVVINLPSALPKLLVEARREHLDVPPFQGDGRGAFYSDELEGLVLDGDETIDDVPLIDDLTQLDFIGDRLSKGEYEFPATKTLPGKFEVTLERILQNSGVYPSDAIDDRSELIDAWTDFDGLLAEDTTAAVYFRSSDEIPVDFEFLLEADPDLFLLEDGSKLLQESSILFGPWTVLDKTTFVGRTFQFKAELEAFHPDQTPLVQELGYEMSLRSRTENSAVIASGAGAYSVTFANAFYEEPAVGITAFNLASGDYYEVTSATRTGFTVHFKNSSNSSVSRDFQYVAAGFGSEQT